MTPSPIVKPPQRRRGLRFYVALPFSLLLVAIAFPFIIATWAISCLHSVFEWAVDEVLAPIAVALTAWIWGGAE